MARPKNSRDIAPEIRGAFLRALKIREHEGKGSLSDMILAAIDDHGILKVLDVMAKFTPRSMDVTNTELSAEDWLERMANDNNSEREGPCTADALQGQFH